MAIRVSERELHELGLAVDPKDPSRAVPLHQCADRATIDGADQLRSRRILVTMRRSLGSVTWILRPSFVGVVRLLLLLVALLDLCVAKLTHHATIQANRCRRRSRASRQAASRRRIRRRRS